MYVVWFCYIYENFAVIRRPLGAIEELTSEFKAPDVIDTPDQRIATAYAGVGAEDLLPPSKRLAHLKNLKPHYEKAVLLLTSLYPTSD
jgi:hypothetical protein